MKKTKILRKEQPEKQTLSCVDSLMIGLTRTLESIATDNGNYIVRHNQTEIIKYLDILESLNLAKKSYQTELEYSFATWLKYECTEYGREAYNFLKRIDYFPKK